MPKLVVNLSTLFFELPMENRPAATPESAYDPVARRGDFWKLNPDSLSNPPAQQIQSNVSFDCQYRWY